MIELLNKILNLQKFGIKLGLSSTLKLLNRLGNPHLGLKCVHIAGTNGKGSTGAMLEAIAQNAGLKTGYYTSPHLLDFNERFRINGQPAQGEELAGLMEQVWRACCAGEPPTFFEFATAMAFLLFKKQNVDLAILETGMGGRLDSTNVCQPLLSIITNIGMDHKQYLGNTIKAIAQDKAGIIKQQAPLIHGVTQPGAIRAIEEIARAMEAPVLALGREMQLRRQGELFSIRGQNWKFDNLKTNLRGFHQARNGALAVASARLLHDQYAMNIDAGNIRHGLQQVNWPGRLEKHEKNGVPIWLDGAHNPAAVRALLPSLRLLRAQRKGPLVLVVGIMADKDLKAILKPLILAAEQVIFSQPAYERAASASQLAQIAQADTLNKPHAIEPDLAKAIHLAVARAGVDGSVLVTGSLFTVGEALAILRDA